MGCMHKLLSNGVIKLLNNRRFNVEALLCTVQVLKWEIDFVICTRKAKPSLFD